MNILVIIRLVPEVELARALVAALPNASFYLLFGQEDLRTRFGPTQLRTSIDPLSIVLSPLEIDLVICFSGAREAGATSNLLLLSYFDEIGIATLELQRDLLQDTRAAARLSAARKFLSWQGEDGIGYLKSELPRASAAQVRDDVVLVTSNLDGELYAERERYQFAFAVLRLARENPGSCFLWRPTPSELQQPDANLLLAMVAQLGPDNLSVEENESSDGLVARCSAIVTMVSSALLDYALSEKPGLVFQPGTAAHEGAFSAATFRDYAQLAQLWPKLRADSAAFVIEAKVPRLDVQKLLGAGEELARSSALSPNWRAISLRYLAQLQDARARADVGRINPSIAALDKRLTSVEQALSKLSTDLATVLDRVGALPLSSVAHKALKLVARVRKKAFKG